MGLHNTLDELLEAQKIVQLKRLSKSITGRHVVRALDITYRTQQGRKTDIASEQKAHIYMPPLPRNMHLVHHRER